MLWNSSKHLILVTLKHARQFIILLIKVSKAVKNVVKDETRWFIVY